MSIPYSLILRQVHPGKPKEGNKTYPVAQVRQVMSLSDMAKHMSSHSSKYDKGDVMAVATQLTSCIREQLLLGNKVVLGDLKSLERTEMQLKSWNVVNPSQLFGRDDVIVKIRYRKQENRCTVTLLPDNTLHVQLHEPLAAIAPGQAAAFYRDQILLGGGIIMEE